MLIRTLMIGLLLSTAAAFAQKTTINNSRSNIKNNIAFTQSPNGKILCTSEGKPCSIEQVKLLDAKLSELAKATPGKADGGVTLAADGTLQCGARPCSSVHVANLEKAAVALDGANDPIAGVSIGLGTAKQKEKMEKQK